MIVDEVTYVTCVRLMRRARESRWCLPSAAIKLGKRRTCSMNSSPKPIAIVARMAPVRTKPSNYPEPFASRVLGRTKRPLGDSFGIKNFGVNLTSLAPGAASSLLHRHSRQDEFIYIVEGEATLVIAARNTRLQPGMCAGFPSNNGDAHMLINHSEKECVYLEFGDRTSGDSVDYPHDDLVAIANNDGAWEFFHKDGTAYPK